MEVFPVSATDRLGFAHIIERLRNLVISVPGENRLDAMRPARSLEWLQSEYERLTELQEVIRFDDPVPFEPIPDIRSFLRRAAPEDAYLDGSQLLDTAAFARTSRLLFTYFQRRRSRYERLWEVAGTIGSLPDLEEQITGAVETDGDLVDDASPELKRIRSLINRRQVQLRETLMRELRHAIGQGWATEEQPTMRNGRMVIPVRAEAKRKLQGFVQDTSASGQTVYVEPAACLDLNNELRELQGEERREIERILRRLTSLVRRDLELLKDNVRRLATLDLLQAKARFANELDARAPTLDVNGELQIVRGRNPVLELHFRKSMDAEQARSRIVPLDLSLGGEYRTLIITGPNAGGKTVAMKTVGLFALMTAHGIALPAAEKTRMPLFDCLLVDIGDQQSIEEDLSTFSSHVSNLREMLTRAGSGSLILIDEAGTGTDPDEGGALAQAVLEQLNTAGARTIATTHHGTLKAFAHQEEGVENGSMEFDRETLSPTYRFVAGVPGSSYAFEIARRTGLDKELLDRARELTGIRTSGLQELISDFERRNQELERVLSEATSARNRASHELQTFEDQRRKLERERDDIRRQALEEAERIVSHANARVERTIREIKEAQAEREATRQARHRLQSLKDELDEGLDEVEDEAVSAPPAPRDRGGVIREGDQVVVDNGQTRAEVMEVDGDEAVVTLGSMKLRVKTSRLTRVGGRRKQQVTVRQASSQAGGIAAASARTRIDLRGMRVEEALPEVQRLLDEALQTSQSRVELLHGKGTGALRDAIHDFLSRAPEVATFEDAPWNEGGSGVTYVILH